MSPYTAAEYIIEALGKSSTFSIGCHDVNILLQRAGKDVKSYIKKECQDDLLLLFKQLPDVFVWNGSTITLTDAFLSLHAFPKSADFSANYKCDSVYETFAIEYFKLIITRCGMCHYNTLFNVLLTQESLQMANYFSNYSMPDMYAFFQKHSDTFTISHNNVFLNIYPTLNVKPPGSKEDDFTSHKKLAKTTYFLLSCFEALHYIELKQIISFVWFNVKNFLNKHSLIKQREIFENLTDTSMDKMGYISLKNVTAPLPKSKTGRLIVLIVCILAFEREMHFLKVSQEVEKRVSSNVSSSLCGTSISEQFKFFKSFSDFFVIYDNGYVTLLPSFVFPQCTFDNSLTKPQACPISLPLSVPTSQYNTKSSEVTHNLNAVSKNSSSSHLNTIHNSENLLTTCTSPLVTPNSTSSCYELKTFHDVNGISNSLTKYPSIINVRTRLSMIFLIGSFKSPACETVIKSCLYVLDDVRISFCTLSHAGQHIYVRECRDFINNVLNERLSNDVPAMPCVNDREKSLLFIVYVLILQKSVHFDKMTNILISSKIAVAFLLMGMSNTFHYYRELCAYITISSDGYISLNQAFIGINSIVDSHLVDLSKMLSAPVSNTLTNKEVNDSSPKCEPSTTDADFPFNIYKRLELALFYLTKCFKSLVAVHVLETVLHSLTDVKTYFNNLSTLHQHRFIKKYFECINSESVIEIVPQDIQSSTASLSEHEKALLAISYALIQSSSLHYEKLINKLKKFGIEYPLKVSKQFKYFKTFNEQFVITGDGLVSLSPSFSPISAIASSLPTFSKEIRKKFHLNIKIRNQAEFCTENTSNGSLQNVNANMNGADKSIKSTPDTSLVDTVIDISFSVLSVCDKMKIEKLCNYLNSSGVKSIHNYFSFYTVSEKMTFFTNIPHYFDVSRDGFVGLKKDVISSYVPKTSLITRDAKGRFVIANTDMTNGVECSSRAESVRSGDVSDWSDTISCGSNSTKKSNQSKKKRSKRFPQRNFKIDPQALSNLRNFLGSGNGAKKVVNTNAQKEGNVSKDKQTIVKKESLEGFVKETPSATVSSDILGEQKFTSELGRRITKQHHSFVNSFPPDNNLQSKTDPKSNFEFNVSRQPIKTKNSEILKAADSSAKNVNGNLRMSSAGPNSPKTLLNLQPCQYLKKTVLQEKAIFSEVPLKINHNGEMFPGGTPTTKLNDDNLVSKDLQLRKDSDKKIARNEEISSEVPLKITQNGEKFPADIPASNLLSGSEDLDSYTLYGMELLNSFLGENKPDVTNLSGSINSTGSEKNQIVHENCNVNGKKEICKSFSVENNSSCENLKTGPNSGDGNLLPLPPIGISQSKSSDVVELRAVNFFYAILGNYDIGVSVDFLIKHLNLASSEVQTYMFNSYHNDVASFFSKHKKVFYVSPQTKNVYLVQKH